MLCDPTIEERFLDPPLPANLESRDLAISSQTSHSQRVQLQVFGCFLDRHH
jgi:hypothetical protein